MNNIPPSYEELDKMMEFIARMESIYLLGAGQNQILFEKYLNMCNVPVEGYIVSEEYKDPQNRRMFSIDDIIKSSRDNIGILTLIPDRYYNETVTRLFQAGFTNIFFVSEHNKNAIALKMKPYKQDEFHLDISLAQHCNLDCQMCDHFSPVAKPRFYDLDKFKKDLGRIGELFEHKMNWINLIGGEPLLNRNIIQYMKITREQFSDTCIAVITNGVLLLQSENWEEGNFWKACKDYNIRLMLTIYPIHLDFEAMDRKAEEYGIEFVKFNNAADFNDKRTKYSVFHPLDLDGKQDKYIFASCYHFNKCMSMEDGRIYTCPIIPNICHFNDAFSQNLQVTNIDSINIYDVKNWQEITEFCSRRADFCRYCNIRGRKSFEWKQSSHTMYEWVEES